MTEKYLEKVIEEKKMFREPFSSIEVSQEKVFYPIAQFNPVMMNDGDSYVRAALDYGLDVFSPADTMLALHRPQKIIINEGSQHVINSNASHVVLLGMYGIGKTSMLNQISYLIAKEKNPSRVPVVKKIEEIDFENIDSINSSVFDDSLEVSRENIVLLVDGMNEQVKKFLDFFLGCKRCVFTSSFKHFINLKGFKVFTIEPLSISLQIARAQQHLSASQFIEYIEKVTASNSQLTEFSRLPLCHSFLLSRFEKLKHLNRGSIYLNFLKEVIGGTNLWHSLESIACEVIDKEINVFGFHDIRYLGHSESWESLKTLEVFAKSEPLTYVSLSEFSCSDIESEVNQNEPELVVKDSITEFSITSDCHLLRFTHIRHIETLAAQNLLNQVEDSMVNIKKPTYIESQEFQKVFLKAFPSNYLFSKKYQEVLMLFAQICQDNIFENLVKYLISINNVECCYLAERILKENRSEKLQHLLNKVSNQKQELVVKDFTNGLTHYSSHIRAICRTQLLLVNAPVGKILSSQLTLVLNNSSWLMLSSFLSLSEFINIEDLYQALEIQMILILESIHSHQLYSSSHLNCLLKILVTALEKTKPNSSTTQTPSKTEELLFDESTLRMSLNSLKLSRNTMNDSMRRSGKLEKKMLEILMKMKGLSVKYLVKALMCTHTKKRMIRMCLLQRSKVIEDESKMVVLKGLNLMKCKEEEVFAFYVGCLQEKDCKETVRRALRNMDVNGIKKKANWMIQNNRMEGVLALSECCRYGLDPDIVDALTQFVDNSDSYLSLLGVKAFYTILKNTEKVNISEFLVPFSSLAEIIMDRVQLIKNVAEVRIKYIKCLLIILKHLGEFRKIIEICQNTIANINEKYKSSLYHLLLKLQLGSKYLEKLKDLFEKHQFGVNGKYILKIAENNLTWRSEETAAFLISYFLPNISPKCTAALLVKWDVLYILEQFCNLENLKLFPRVKEILDSLQPSEEKTGFLSLFRRFLSRLKTNLNEFVFELGLDFVAGLTAFDMSLDWAKEWLIEFIIECEDILTIERAVNIFKKFNKDPMINIYLEQKLLKLIHHSPERTLNICRNLSLKSDEILTALLPYFLNKTIEISLLEPTVIQIIQKKSADFLITLHKLVYFSSSSPDLTCQVHKAVNHILYKLIIKNEMELETFIEAACRFSCGIYFEHVWKYILAKIALNPRYCLSEQTEEMLKTSVSWDARFTLKFSRILGLFRCKKNSEEFTQSTTSRNY